MNRNNCVTMAMVLVLVSSAAGQTSGSGANCFADDAPSCNAIEGCAWQDLHNTCFQEGVLIPCNQLSETCTQDNRCDQIEETCFDKSEGAPCFLTSNSQQECESQSKCAFVEVTEPFPEKVCYETAGEFPCFIFDLNNCPDNCFKSNGVCVATVVTTEQPMACSSFTEEIPCLAGPSVCQWDAFSNTCSDFSGQVTTGGPMMTVDPDSCGTLNENDCNNNFNVCSFDFDQGKCTTRQCSDAFDESSCSQLGCKYFTAQDGSDAFCYDDSMPVPCSRYQSATSCENDVSGIGCTFNSDAFTCFKSGTQIPCASFFLQEACDDQGGRCQFFPDDSLCWGEGEDVECGNVGTESTCKTVGCEFVTLKSEDGLETQDVCKDKNEDVSCESIFTGSICSAQQNCRLGQFNQCEACDGDCFDVTTEAPSPCQQAFGQPACEGTVGCKYDMSQDTCVDCSEGESTNECRGIVDCASKSAEECVAPACAFEFAEGTQDGGSEGSCRARGCEDLFGSDCGTKAGCVLLGGSDGTCYDENMLPTCEEISFQQAPCEDDRVDCKWVDQVGCTDPNVQVACDQFPAELLCPQDRCTWFSEVGQVGACDVPGKQFACSDYSVDVVCNAKSGCEFSYSTSVCKGVNDQTDCGSIFNEGDCDGASDCMWSGDETGSCSTCSGQNCEPDPLAVCSNFQENTCGVDEMTQHCFFNQTCGVRSCEQIFSPLLCHRVPGCTYSNTFSGCFDSNTQNFNCNSARNRPGCDAAPNCKWFAQINSCRDNDHVVLCTDIASETACPTLSSCKWFGNINGGICESQDYAPSCNELNSATCLSDDFKDQCDFDNIVSFCKPAGTETPCEKFQSFNCPDGEDEPCIQDNFQCFNRSTYTTPPPTTTTPPNPCDADPCGFRKTCTPIDSVNFECSECPPGTFENSNGNCNDITCNFAAARNFPNSNIKENDQGERRCESTAWNSVCELTCRSGFELIGSPFITCGDDREWVGNVTCVDFDECSTNPCDELTECTNRLNRFTCSACPNGYEGTGETGCIDINECDRGTDRCDDAAECINTPGSFRCGPCPQGYLDENNGTDCRDINECNTDNPCNENAQCKNLIPGVECTCQPGYDGDGFGSNGCTPKDCGQPSPSLVSVSGVSFDCESTQFLGAGCLVTCPSGKKGTAQLTCQEDGTWGLDSQLQCVDAVCSPNLLGDGADVIGTIDSNAFQTSTCNIDVSSTCSLTCGPGSFLRSSSPYTCNNNGRWEGGSVTCEPCDGVNNYQSNSGQNSCVNVRTCASSEYQSVPPTKTSNAQCSSLSQCELGVTYERTAPSKTSDRVCASVRSCQAGSQFQSSAPTLTSDRSCGSCPVCRNQQRVTEACPGNAPVPSQYLPLSTSTACKNCNMTCPEEYYRTEACNSNLGTRCSVVTVCKGNDPREISPPTATTDRRCGDRLNLGETEDGRAIVISSFQVHNVDVESVTDERGIVQDSFRRVLIKTIRKELTGTRDLKVSIYSVVPITSGNRRRLLQTGSYAVDYMVDAEVVGIQRKEDIEQDMLNKLQDHDSVTESLRSSADDLGVSGLETAENRDQNAPVQSSDDNSNLIIIIAAAAGAVLLIAVIIAVCCCCRKSKNSADIASADYYEAEMKPMGGAAHEIYEPDTIEIRPGGTGTIRRSRQSSFYSSLAVDGTEA